MPPPTSANGTSDCRPTSGTNRRPMNMASITGSPPGTTLHRATKITGIFCWPGTIQQDAVESQPAGLVDVLPTMCGLLGIDKPSGRHLDGADLTPLLTGSGQLFQRHQPLFWHLQKARPIVAIRDGDYSLVADPDYELSTSNMFQEAWIPKIKSGTYTNFRLYNLADDPEQQHDIADEHPALLGQLKTKLRAINASVMADEHVKAYFGVFETARQAHGAKYGGRAGLSQFTESYTTEKKVLANWKAIRKILDAHPYALNPGPIRPTTPRMAGLHPEYPARKWKPQPKSERPEDLDLD